MIETSEDSNTMAVSLPLGKTRLTPVYRIRNLGLLEDYIVLRKVGEKICSCSWD